MSDEAPPQKDKAPPRSSEALRKRPSGLGRGLSALLGDPAREAPGAGPAAEGEVRRIPIASIEAHPAQPRRTFDEAALDELAASIAERGLLQPILVRPHGHRFQIVAGERRWRAAQRARLHEIPAIVRELSEAETLETALLENIQREDLNAIEEARGFRRLVDDFGHSQDALGKIVHKSRSHVANLLRLLDLPPEVQALVENGQLSMGHARALVGAADPAGLAAEIIRRGLTVRDAEMLARGGKKPRRRQPATGEVGSGADIEALERQLGDLLGLRVSIRHSEKGGVVSLAYSSLDQLDMICQRLSGERF